MVQYQINNQLDPPLVALLQQSVKILHAAVQRINGLIIRHVIFMIGRGRHNGHQPDPVKTHVRHIVQLGNYSLQISDSVAVAVVKRIHKYLIPCTVIIVNYLHFPGAPILSLAACPQAAHQQYAKQQYRQHSLSPFSRQTHLHSSSKYAFILCKSSVSRVTPFCRICQAYQTPPPYARPQKVDNFSVGQQS